MDSSSARLQEGGTFLFQCPAILSTCIVYTFLTSWNRHTGCIDLSESCRVEVLHEIFMQFSRHVQHGGGEFSSTIFASLEFYKEPSKSEPNSKWKCKCLGGPL